LFADDLEIALQLLDGLAGACGSGDLHIDVPADNIGFIAALESGGFAPTFATTRMYKGPAPKLGPQRLFGVTTLELG
ncbi:GNAT family N-acetyltransferase, partial [Mesorhizobium sp. M7D.F.Ca.US.004.03.1.1]